MIHCNFRLQWFHAYGFLSDILYAFLFSITRATYLSFCEASFHTELRGKPNRAEQKGAEPNWPKMIRLGQNTYVS